LAQKSDFVHSKSLFLLIKIAHSRSIVVRYFAKSRLLTFNYLNSPSESITLKMSKRKPVKTRKVAKKVTAVKAKPAATNWMNRPSTATANDAFLKKLFLGIGALICVIMLVQSLDVGFNGDDEFQHAYSEALLDYYTGENPDAAIGENLEGKEPRYNKKVKEGKMYLYGGFFDIVTGVLNRTMGYTVNDEGYHTLRHLFNALFGFLAIFFTGLLAKQIAGWRAGILAMVLMFLSPRFLGHSLMNPKDIPFAAGYVIALYYMVKLLKGFPNFNWKTALGFVLGAALAISTRAGGFLIIAYFGLFGIIDLAIKASSQQLKINANTIGKYVGYGALASLGAFIVALAFWPYALDNPFTNPMNALNEFSKLGVKIRVLFAGENIMSDATPWYYSLSWIYRTIPLFALVGFVGSLVLIAKLAKQYHIVPVLLVIFAAIFPVFYVIIKDSTIHDGWRHLMFVYPPLLVTATLFWVTLEKQFLNNKNVKYAIYGVLGLFALDPALYIARNPHLAYTYFSPITGGVSGNYGDYETDYWGLSIKESIDWMEEEGIIAEDMTETITIMSNFSYVAQKYLTKKYKGKVNVTVNSTPIAIVLKDTEKYAMKGEQAIQARDFPKAIEQFTLETTKYPKNELGWLGLSNANINAGNAQAGLDAANTALGVAPNNLVGLYFKGLALLNQNKVSEAEKSFLTAVQTNDEYAVAHYYLGLISLNRKDYSTAESYAKKALATNKNGGFVKSIYKLFADLYQGMGNTDLANQYRAASQK